MVASTTSAGLRDELIVQRVMRGCRALWGSCDVEGNIRMFVSVMQMEGKNSIMIATAGISRVD